MNMQAVKFTAARWPVIRAFGGNPLVRISDRIEAIVVVAAVALSLLAVPVASAIGTTVHETQSRVYAEAAHTSQPIRAIVTTTRHTNAVARLHPNTTVVQARWRTAGIEHVATFTSERPVAVGDRVDIWVNDAGDRVAPPPPPSHAVVDAISVAVLLWVVAVGAAAALVALVRWRLNRRHDTDWEREIAGLADRRWAD
jgi:hypothetical protein